MFGNDIIQCKSIGAASIQQVIKLPKDQPIDFIKHTLPAQVAEE